LPKEIVEDMDECELLVYIDPPSFIVAAALVDE
jgi:hypothetical protein